MSEKRSDDMAIIEAALANGATITDNDSGERVTSADFKDTTDEHEAISSPLTEIVKEVSGTSDQPPKPANTGEQGLKLKSQQQSLLKQRVQATGQSAGRAVGSVKNGLGNVSLPGGLLAPLLTIIVLFFLLVQVNGHTRFTWLWLVATQNAAIADPTGGTGMGGGGGDTSVSVSTPAVLPALAPVYVNAYVPLDMDEW